MEIFLTFKTGAINNYLNLLYDLISVKIRFVSSVYTSLFGTYFTFKNSVVIVFTPTVTHDLPIYIFLRLFYCSLSLYLQTKVWFVSRVS